jgi:prophage tail gpP-like protein
MGAPFDFTVQQGEAGWEAIERITRLRQVLAYEQADGSLLVTRVSEDVCQTKLVQGGNILAAQGTLDDRDRFSHYIVKGQQKGKDDTSPKQAAQSLGTIEDPSVRRYRPKLIVSSADTDNGTALDRAKWEKQQRWGKARSAEITVPGWLMPDGKTWPINRLCDIEDGWLQLDRRMAIGKSVINASATGLRTILTLQPPEALTPAPPDTDKTASAKGGAGGPSFWDQVAADRQAGEARRRESKQ